MKNPQEPNQILTGDIDPAGNLNSTIIHQFGQRWRGKFQAQMSKTNNMSAGQGILEYRGNIFTSSLTGVNIDVVNNSGNYEFFFFFRKKKKLNILIYSYEVF